MPPSLSLSSPFRHDTLLRHQNRADQRPTPHMKAKKNAEFRAGHLGVATPLSPQIAEFFNVQGFIPYLYSFSAKFHFWTSLPFIKRKRGGQDDFYEVQRDKMTGIQTTFNKDSNGAIHFPASPVVKKLSVLIQSFQFAPFEVIFFSSEQN